MVEDRVFLLVALLPSPSINLSVSFKKVTPFNGFSLISTFFFFIHAKYFNNFFVNTLIGRRDLKFWTFVVYEKLYMLNLYYCVRWMYRTVYVECIELENLCILKVYIIWKYYICWIYRIVYCPWKFVYIEYAKLYHLCIFIEKLCALNLHSCLRTFFEKRCTLNV